MLTSYERGKIEGQRDTALRQLTVKFGPLSPAVKNWVEALSPEQLQQLLDDLLTAQSLRELHLED